MCSNFFKIGISDSCFLPAGISIMQTAYVITQIKIDKICQTIFSETLFKYVPAIVMIPDANRDGQIFFKTFVKRIPITSCITDALTTMISKRTNARAVVIT